ncbi:DUF2911 domain-containing protein [Rhodohalobacter sp. 8-1]|uniref:DUF2911 domain-containing protein n=1 Tax=Rhodohalobacter sp. 8-1 TaxID=3131972 RepID=UPI0030EDD9F9
MLKNRILTIIAACSLALLISLPVAAQERSNDGARTSPNAAVSQTIGTTEVTLTYGRPSVNNRNIFGGLVPYDEVWRTGANESTAITFSDDVLIEGERVEAGTYSLYSEPGEETWSIIINDKLSWGTQYDMSEDVLRVEVDAEESYFVEQMLIYFEDISEESGDMVIHWADTRVSVQIEPVNE